MDEGVRYWLLLGYVNVEEIIDLQNINGTKNIDFIISHQFNGH